MPRVARVKHENGIYHIMVRSISDIPLFRDSADKDKYLQLIKKYQGIYLFKVYAYCLMTTHGHMAIDCCGADISKIMKSINQSLRPILIKNIIGMDMFSRSIQECLVT